MEITETGCTIPMEYLESCVQLITDCFGITYAFFAEDLHKRSLEDNRIYVSINSQYLYKVDQLCNSVKTIAIPERARIALGLVAVVLGEGRMKSLCDDWDRDLEASGLDLHYEDLLKLYLFAYKGYPHSSEDDGILKIKRGDEVLELNDSDMWFKHSVLNSYFANVLPEITSIEEAENELKSLHTPQGAPKKTPFCDIIINGISLVFERETNMALPTPDDMCKFIVKYLEMIHPVVKDELDNIYSTVDKEWVRRKVLSFIKKPIPTFLRVNWPGLIDEIRAIQPGHSYQCIPLGDRNPNVDETIEVDSPVTPRFIYPSPCKDDSSGPFFLEYKSKLYK